MSTPKGNLPPTRAAIVADVPTADPAFGFANYAKVLADAAATGQPAQFTLGIYGRWGSGKSSLLRSIRKSLEFHTSVIAVEFDAWRYERTGEIVLPLLHAVVQQAEREHEPELRDKVRALIRAFGLSLSFQLPVVGAGISGRDVRDAWVSESGRLDVELDEVFAGPFDRLRELGLSLAGRRIVVLIDDLDRCSSGSIVAVLESINVLTDIPGFVFVLAIDYDVLVRAVEARYPHANGHQFIEKIVQVPFRVPRPLAERDQFLESIIPQISDMPHLVPIRGILERIADGVFSGNPRSIKRFVNSLTLIMQMMDSQGATYRSDVVATLLATELRWPEEFQDVRTATYAGDDDPLIAVRESEDVNLASFAATLPPFTHEELSSVLRITASVAELPADDEAATERDVGRTRTDVGRATVLELLDKYGFSLGRNSTSAYYRSGSADARVFVAKAVVRIEVRNTADSGRPWGLMQSFSLVREVAEFEAALRSIYSL